MPCRNGTRKSEPAEARSVLGLYGLAVPLRNRTPVAPKASAARTMVPVFPGSWSASNTITSAFRAQLFELPFARPHQRHHALAGLRRGDSVEKRIGQHHDFRARQTPPVSLHRARLLSAASTVLTSQGLRSASSSRWKVSATTSPRWSAHLRHRAAHVLQQRVGGARDRFRGQHLFTIMVLETVSIAHMKKVLWNA